MSDPWDIPPFPLFGDATEGEVQSAQSRALKVWEGIEDSLSALAASFDEAGHNYGAGATFLRRISNLQKSACVYFAKHPSQDTEGELRTLIAYICNMADRRNDIAHGVVMPYTSFPTENIADLPTPTRFALCPEKYDTKRERFVYSSKEIGVFVYSLF